MILTGITIKKISTNAMTISLHTCSPLQEIQSTFTKYFPGLKIDFIFHGNEDLVFSNAHHSSFLFTPVCELYPDCTEEQIVLKETMSTKEVELLFENAWHLPAKVYADVDGYWQKNSKTENQLLKEYISSSENISTVDF